MADNLRKVKIVKGWTAVHEMPDELWGLYQVLCGSGKDAKEGAAILLRSDQELTPTIREMIADIVEAKSGRRSKTFPLWYFNVVFIYRWINEGIGKTQAVKKAADEFHVSESEVWKCLKTMDEFHTLYTQSDERIFTEVDWEK